MIESLSAAAVADGVASHGRQRVGWTVDAVPTAVGKHIGAWIARCGTGGAGIQVVAVRRQKTSFG